MDYDVNNFFLNIFIYLFMNLKIESSVLELLGIFERVFVSKFYHLLNLGEIIRFSCWTSDMIYHFTKRLSLV